MPSFGGVWVEISRRCRVCVPVVCPDVCFVRESFRRVSSVDRGCLLLFSPIGATMSVWRFMVRVRVAYTLLLKAVRLAADENSRLPHE